MMNDSKKQVKIFDKSIEKIFFEFLKYRQINPIDESDLKYIRRELRSPKEDIRYKKLSDKVAKKLYEFLKGNFSNWEISIFKILKIEINLLSERDLNFIAILFQLEEKRSGKGCSLALLINLEKALLYLFDEGKIIDLYDEGKIKLKKIWGKIEPKNDWYYNLDLKEKVLFEGSIEECFHFMNTFIYIKSKEHLEALREKNVEKLREIATKIGEDVAKKVSLGYGYSYNFRQRLCLMRELENNGFNASIPLNQYDFKKRIKEAFEVKKKGKDVIAGGGGVWGKIGDELSFNIEIDGWYLKMYGYLLYPLKYDLLPNIYERERMDNEIVDKYVSSEENQKNRDDFRDWQKYRNLEKFDILKLNELEVGVVIYIYDTASLIYGSYERDYTSKYKMEVKWYDADDYDFKEEYYKIIKENQKSFVIEGIMTEQRGRLRKKEDIYVRTLNDYQVRELQRRINFHKYAQTSRFQLYQKMRNLLRKLKDSKIIRT